MAAKVYSVPEGMEAPELMDFRDDNGRPDVPAYFTACHEHQDKVAAWCRENSSDDIAGETIEFGVADGKAVYMVWKLKPLSLLWLDYMDGYAIDDMMLRGMRVADVRTMVEQNKKLAELFGHR